VVANVGAPLPARYLPLTPPSSLFPVRYAFLLPRGWPCRVSTTTYQLRDYILCSTRAVPTAPVAVSRGYVNCISFDYSAKRYTYSRSGNNLRTWFTTVFATISLSPSAVLVPFHKHVHAALWTSILLVVLAVAAQRPGPAPYTHHGLSTAILPR